MYQLYVNKTEREEIKSAVKNEPLYYPPLQEQISKHEILTVLQASSSKTTKNRGKEMILSSFYETQVT